MSSEGTGAEISPEDAISLLHKLITESIKVQAMFVSGAGVTAAVSGLVKVAGDSVGIVERNERGSPTILFDPARATSRRYGDRRAFSAVLESSGGAVLESALVFVLPDGSQLALFEIADNG